GSKRATNEVYTHFAINDCRFETQNTQLRLVFRTRQTQKLGKGHIRRSANSGTKRIEQNPPHGRSRNSFSNTERHRRRCIVRNSCKPSLFAQTSADQNLPQVLLLLYSNHWATRKMLSLKFVQQTMEEPE